MSDACQHIRMTNWAWWNRRKKSK